MHIIRSPLNRTASALFQVSLAIFVITIVIGILNGLDVWDPGRTTLLTHVHAGTLGWITLAIVGAALLMFSDAESLTEKERRRVSRMAVALAVSIGLYVVAFWSGFGIQRPISGTLVFAAVIWLYAWVIGRMRQGSMTVPRFAMFAALTSLVIGAVFGVLLGIFIARGSVPGLTNQIAVRLADAHPGTMVIGYLLLAGTAVTEWLLRSEHRKLSRSKWGVVQVVAIFAAGAILIAGFLLDDENLVALNLPLEVLGVGIFLARMWPELRPRSWRGAPVASLFARFSVVFLAINLVQLAHVVQLFVSDVDAFDDPDNLGVLLALDHVMFIGVITNGMFAVVAAVADGSTSRKTSRLTLWGLQIGLAGFALGLFTDTVVLKRIAAPVMGVALLVGIVTFISGLRNSMELDRSKYAVPDQE